MNRRKFFKRLKQAACVIALAPQIAFHVHRRADEAFFMHAYEMKACGIPRYGLMDWFYEQERKAGRTPRPSTGSIPNTKVNFPSPETLKRLFKC